MRRTTTSAKSDGESQASTSAIRTSVEKCHSRCVRRAISVEISIPVTRAEAGKVVARERQSSPMPDIRSTTQSAEARGRPAIAWWRHRAVKPKDEIRLAWPYVDAMSSKSVRIASGSYRACAKALTYQKLVDDRCSHTPMGAYSPIHWREQRRDATVKRATSRMARAALIFAVNRPADHSRRGTRSIPT